MNCISCSLYVLRSMLYCCMLYVWALRGVVYCGTVSCPGFVFCSLSFRLSRLHCRHIICCVFDVHVVCCVVCFVSCSIGERVVYTFDMPLSKRATYCFLFLFIFLFFLSSSQPEKVPLWQKRIVRLQFEMLLLLLLGGTGDLLRLLPRKEGSPLNERSSSRK